jgi:hypothetical protein
MPTDIEGPRRTPPVPTVHVDEGGEAAMTEVRPTAKAHPDVAGSGT